MSTPIIIVAGRAGSGKDTVAGHLAKKYNAVTVAQADPMKRFARLVLEFSPEQLWGPSEMRNTPTAVGNIHTGGEQFWTASQGLFLDAFGRELEEPEDPAFEALVRWVNWHVNPNVKEGKISPRIVLQTLGTEWGRQFSPRMWVDSALRTCRTLLEGEYGYNRETGLIRVPGMAPDYAVITDGRFRNEVLGVTLVNGVALRVQRPDTDKKALGLGIQGHRSEKELDSIPSHFYTDTIVNDGTFDDLFDKADQAMAVNFGDCR